jgi:hypothetical protein
MRKLLLAAAVAVACAATAAPAMAGSIAYIKDGNVFLSTDDGSRQFQVTTSGAYADVTQADDGTMIALTGIRLHKLDRLGNILADFDTPVSDSRPAGSRLFFGPYDPAISPNGQRLSYTYYYMTQSQNPTCFPPECVTTINEGGTGYSRTDRQTGWDENGFRKHSGWRNAIWADDDTTILSDPTHLPNHDVVVDKPDERTGGGYMAKNWFSDTVDGNPGMGAGDVTRDKRKLVYVTGEADSTLTVYSVPSFPTTFPDGEAAAADKPIVCYRYSNPVGGKFATPTFSPDGSRAAVAAGDGVHVVTVPDFSAGCTTSGASQSTQLLIAGATQPDWGPAEVPASRPVAPKPTPTPAPGKGGDKSGGGAPGATATLAVARAAIKKALARGLSVKLAGAKPGKVALVARFRGKAVAKAAATVAADGSASARLKFTKAARKSLRRLKKVTLVVSGGGAEATIVLRRK